MIDYEEIKKLEKKVKERERKIINDFQKRHPDALEIDKYGDALYKKYWAEEFPEPTSEITLDEIIASKELFPEVIEAIKALEPLEVESLKKVLKKWQKYDIDWLVKPRINGQILDYIEFAKRSLEPPTPPLENYYINGQLYDYS